MAYWVSTTYYSTCYCSAHGLLDVYKGLLYLLLQCSWPTGCLQVLTVLVIAVVMAYWVSTSVDCTCYCSAHGLLDVYKGLLYLLLQCSWPTGCLQGFTVLVIAVLMAYWVSTRVYCTCYCSAHGLLGVFMELMYLLQCSWPTGCLQVLTVLVAVFMAYWVSTSVDCTCCSAHGLLGVYKGLMYLLQCSWPTGCLQGINVLVAVLMAYWVSTSVDCTCCSAHGLLGVYKRLMYLLQ